jgi:hypothetical protein
MAGFGRLMCPLDVLSGLSILTCSGTIIIPRLVSRLTYDHLFTEMQLFESALVIEAAKLVARSYQFP